MFRVGIKVVMLRKQTSYDAAFGDDRWPSCIYVGGVYTVRDVDTRAAGFGWPIVLRFEEFSIAADDLSDLGIGMWEPGFPGDCFRPVTDISFAHEILRSVDRRIDA